MINDAEIDLTMDHKFSKVIWRVTPSEKTYDKLFKKNTHSDLFYKYCKPSSELPWNKRKLDNVEDLSNIRQKRKNKDLLSDDFGATIRLTEDNTILCFGDRPRNPIVLEEYLMEVLGYIPYHSISFCLECSHKHIHSLKNKNAWGTCEFHRTHQLPWAYTRGY